MKRKILGLAPVVATLAINCGAANTNSEMPINTIQVTGEVVIL